MTSFRNLCLSLSLAALGVALALRAAEPPAPVVTDTAQWIPLYGEKWWEHYAKVYEGWFPGGRSDRYHDRYIQTKTRWRNDPITTDWKIFNRKYIFDGKWFAVEWFYRATHTDDGFQQWEATLGIGRINDEGKMDLWIEYFDDNVGNLQRIGLMPFYSDEEFPFPWPEKAAETISLPYRP